jgi:hypothetical protein
LDTVAKSEQERATVWTSNEETEIKFDRVIPAEALGAFDGDMSCDFARTAEAGNGTDSKRAEKFSNREDARRSSELWQPDSVTLPESRSAPEIENVTEAKAATESRRETEIYKASDR